MDNSEQIKNVKSQKKGKRIGMIIGFAGAVLVIGIVVAVVTILILNSPERKLKKALEERNFEEVIEIYNEEDSNELRSVLEQYVSNSITDYCCGNTDYETTKNILKELSSIIDTDEDMNVIKEIQTSKLSYEKATEYMANEDYVNALYYFEKVIDKDIQNYDLATKKIDEAIEMQLSKVEKLLEEKKYDLAYSMAEKIEKYTQISNKVESIESKIVSEYSEELTAEAQALFDKENYLEAYEFVGKIDSKYITDVLKDIMSNSKTSYVTNQLAKAKEEFDSGNYDAAINILNESNSELTDSVFTNKIEEYKGARNTAIINNNKSKVIYKYDSIEKKYTITSKGLSTDSITIDDSRNIQADINLSNGIPSFFLYWGFENSSWIFMQKIIIDCDGTQYSIEVNYFDRITDISGGNIKEAYAVADSDYDYKQLMKLEPMINSMVGADKVTIRFKGDGYIDKVIPKSHITEIYALWEIYNVLKDNPDLISEL